MDLLNFHYLDFLDKIILASFSMFVKQGIILILSVM